MAIFPNVGLLIESLLSNPVCVGDLKCVAMNIAAAPNGSDIGARRRHRACFSDLRRGLRLGCLGYHLDQVFMTDLVTLIGAPCLIVSTFTTARIRFAKAGVMVTATVACLSLFALVATIGWRLAGMPPSVYLP
ncbi:MAG: hypothetical protein P4M15_13790 [Alphaproteobacteria bacterium]|nr:hypothetical protein [Alphaproteobacteria bacterium]